MRDKKFVLDSIKMDLHRVVTVAGNINGRLSTEGILEFMTHADRDFAKIKLNKREKLLREQLNDLSKSLLTIKDPLSRLRWAEDVLTIRCRI